MREWVSVAEAASILGITKDAVRKRISRKLIEATRKDGLWHVLVDRDATGRDTAPTGAEEAAPGPGRELVEALNAQIEQLTQQNRALWEQFARVSATLDRQSQTLDRILALPATTATRPEEDKVADALRQQIDEQAEQITKLAKALEAERKQTEDAEPKRRGWLDRLLGRQ